MSTKKRITCYEEWLNQRTPKPPNAYARKILRRRNEQIELILKQKQQNEKH